MHIRKMATRAADLSRAALGGGAAIDMAAAASIEGQARAIRATGGKADPDQWAEIVLAALDGLARSILTGHPAEYTLRTCGDVCEHVLTERLRAAEAAYEDGAMILWPAYVGASQSVEAAVERLLRDPVRPIFGAGE